MTEPTSPTATDEDEDRDRIAGLRALPSWDEPEAYRGSVGRTMFDTPGAKDNTVTVLLPTDAVQQVPAQSLVRISSHPDRRRYLAIVVAGPFAEPDGLRRCTRDRHHRRAGRHLHAALPRPRPSRNHRRAARVRNNGAATIPAASEQPGVHRRVGR